MQLTTFALVSILSSSVFAKRDLCNDPKVKSSYGGNCAVFIRNEAAKLSLAQIGAVGAGSNICQTPLGVIFNQLDNRVQSLNGKKDLFDILPTRCIQDVAVHQNAVFNKFYNVLDEYQKKNMYKRNAMCSSQKKYRGTSAETELKDYCKEKKYKEEKEENKKLLAEIENERTKLAEEKAKKGCNSADSVAFTAACIFVPIMAAAVLL